MLEHGPNDVGGGIERLVHVGVDALLGVGVRERAQVLHDRANALRALQRFGDGLAEIAQQELRIHLGNYGFRCFGRRAQLAARAERRLPQHREPLPDAREILEVFAQLREVRVDEAHRVVDLVGDPRRELADRGHLLAL